MFFRFLFHLTMSITMLDDFVEISEGKTKLLVPQKSLTENVPPKTPAFFNPLAKLNRDISIQIYNSFLSTYSNNNESEIIFADSLCGVGARGIRVALEVPKIDRVFLNDVNPLAITAAKNSARLNSFDIDKCNFVSKEVCNFLSSSVFELSRRFDIIDLDPFGSPAHYIDCILRAVQNNGLISVTATDTAVLCGVYPKVCYRKYYGKSIKSSYSNELGIRILLSMISLVASRLDMIICPVFVHANRHYLRVYCSVKLSNDLANHVYENIGNVKHCPKCGFREVVNTQNHSEKCFSCSNICLFAGPLWIKNLFDKNLISNVLHLLEYNNDHQQDPNKNRKENTRLKKIFDTSLSELDNICYYYTLDEIFSHLKTNPKSLDYVINFISSNGYTSSKTIFSPTGFKTDAKMSEIIKLMKNFGV